MIKDKEFISSLCDFFDNNIFNKIWTGKDSRLNYIENNKVFYINKYYTKFLIDSGYMKYDKIESKSDTQDRLVFLEDKKEEFTLFANLFLESYSRGYG